MSRYYYNLIASMVKADPTDPLWDGLQAYYTADNTPNDALGTYNGTLTNGTTYGTGIISNGFSLDGVNDYVDISPSLGASLTAPTSSFSYSAWIYKTKSGQAVIIQNGGSNFGCSMCVTSGGLLGLFYGGGSGVRGVGNSAGFINLNTWHHCVVTYDGAGNIAFYKDGSAVDTQTFSWTDGAGTADAWIGSFLGASNYFGGIIDEVGIWNRVLSSTEVTELYNSGAGKQYPTGINVLWSDLLAYYTADNTPNDALGNYNGTLVNGATYGTGIINQGFSFDGVNDRIDFGNVLDFDGSTAFSFSLWSNPSNLTGVKTLFRKYDASIGEGYVLFYNNGQLWFYLRDGNSSKLDIRTSSSYTTTMTHITLSYDGSRTPSGLKIYIDGVSQTLVTISNTLTSSTSNTADLTLSSDGGVGLSPIGGIIDEVGIWDRELTASEVTELYNSGAGLQY